MYHVMEQLAELNKHFSWKQTGMLVEMHDLFLISPCIPMFMHSVPVLLAFDKGFLKCWRMLCLRERHHCYLV